MNQHRITRRDALKTGSAAAAALAAPTVVSSNVFGAGAPSNRVSVAQIGAGGRGGAHLRSYVSLPDAEVIAVCDCYRSRRDRQADWVNERRGEQSGKGAYKACRAYADFREVIDREDIDAVSIATPDHWHVPIALAAVRAGKHVYCEKPLGLAVAWNQVLRDAVRQHDAVFQYGTQQRSERNFRFACELTRNGYIGKLQRIEAWCPDISQQYDAFHVKRYGSTVPAPVPPDLDYEMWIGPAPMKPFTVDRCTQFGAYHVYDYALGFIAGWGAHPLDIAQWGNDSDGTCPIHYEGKGEVPKKGLYDTIATWDVRCTYANGVTMRFMDWRVAEQPVSAYRKFNNHGTTFFGAEGWVSVDRGGIYASHPGLLQIRLKPEDISLYESESQFGNFVSCVRSGSQTISTIDSAVQSDMISHLSDICIRTGRSICWDPEKEVILDDADASRMLNRALRTPWRL